MAPILALLLLAAPHQPDQKVLGVIRAAIWSDLQLNAMIGNGSWPASRWYNAGSSDQPNLHIQDLTCGQHRKGYRCTFVLFRDGGRVEVFGGQAPDTLKCQADLEPDPERADAWRVKHLAPLPRGGHSRTSLVCS